MLGLSRVPLLRRGLGFFLTSLYAAVITDLTETNKAAEATAK